MFLSLLMSGVLLSLGKLRDACEELFVMISKEAKERGELGFTFAVFASYLEIYNEKISDLLVQSAKGARTYKSGCTLSVAHISPASQRPQCRASRRSWNS